MIAQIIIFASQVNKEFREKLVAGARKKLNSTKDELRSVQNLYTKRMDESDPPPGVSKDDVKEAVAAVRMITESFMASADQLLVIKTKELMGK
jgi:ribosome recycling factor